MNSNLDEEKGNKVIINMPISKSSMSGTADLCFITDVPMLDVIDHLNSYGAPIEEGPVKRTGALGPITSIYTRDPDGNLIEISNY